MVQTVQKMPRRRVPDFPNVDFDLSPFLVIWEVTRACDLACVHCRAEAQPYRHPLELGTEEGFGLIDQIRSFGNPLLVLSGGDPIKRPDIFDLVRYADRANLRVAMTPSGTPLMTRDAVNSLKAAGLSRLAVSLDGSTPEIHDRFRRVSGSYQWTVSAIGYAHDAGLPVQVNTTMTRHNLDDFDGLVRRMIDLGIVLWSVFFLVPTGRGKADDNLPADGYERVLNRLYDLSKEAPFDIKTTAAPHYRRVVLQRTKAERRALCTKHGARKKSPAPTGIGGGGRIGRAAKGVNDGRGFAFISHTGEVYPSGFLPLSAGSIRRRNLVDIYRNSKLFRELRDADLLKGKCGLCEYRYICGGSRARAYAVTGDYLESDPYCAYLPAGLREYEEIPET